MIFPFTKMQGAGNDYIYMCGFNGQPVPSDPSAASAYLSRRCFSVGSDGLILILPSDKADAYMQMFNADGSEGKMCGNGIRCVAKYLYDNNICRKTTLLIDTLSGIKTVKVLCGPDGLVESAVVDMGAPSFEPSLIPLAEGYSPLDMEIEIPSLGKVTVNCVSMGNPHAVCFIDPDDDELDIASVGPEIECHQAFPEHTNVEFVEVLDAHTLRFRVWERGSGETLACGTGICAAVAVCCRKGVCPYGEAITVYAQGGELSVVCVKNGSVFLSGPAVVSYRGEVEYSED